MFVSSSETHWTFLKLTNPTEIRSHYGNLKRHNQAQIIQKSVFLFWLINMAMRCEHVHGLELWKSLKFWAAVAA